MNTIPNPTLPLLGRKIAFSTFIQYGGKAIQLILSVIALKLISGFLDENGASYYGSITEFALFFSVIGNLGIFGNLVRMMADAPTDGKIFTQALILRLVTGGVFYLIAIASLLAMKAEPIFFLGSILFLSALLFDYVTAVCDAMLQANYLMGRATAVLIVGRLLNTLLIFLIVRLSPHIDGLSALKNINLFYVVFLSFFLATLLGSLTTAFLSLYLVKKQIKLSWHWDNVLIKRIFLMSLPFGLINIVNNLYFRFLPDYFAHFHLNDAAFSSFNISFRIAQVLSLVSTFLMFSVLPGLKQYIDEKHWQKAAVLTKKIIVILSAAGVLLFVLGSLFGPQLIELVTHKKYFIPEYWFVFPLMLILAAISYGYDFVLITLFALQEELWFLKREIMALCIGTVFFLSTLFVYGNQLQLLLILLGSISAEFYMVVFGLIRLRHKFKQHHQEVI